MLLRPVQRAVAHEKEKRADDHASANLRHRRTQTLSNAPSQEDSTSKEVSKSCRIERRYRFHGIADRQVRGTPNKVESKEGGDHRQAAWLGWRFRTRFGRPVVRIGVQRRSSRNCLGDGDRGAEGGSRPARSLLRNGHDFTVRQRPIGERPLRNGL